MKQKYFYSKNKLSRKESIDIRNQINGSISRIVDYSLKHKEEVSKSMSKFDSQCKNESSRKSLSPKKVKSPRNRVMSELFSEVAAYKTQNLFNSKSFKTAGAMK